MPNNDLSKSSVPLPMVLIALLVTGGGFYWLSHLQSLMDEFITRGSPQVTVLDAKVVVLEKDIGSIEARLGKLEGWQRAMNK